MDVHVHLSSLEFWDYKPILAKSGKGVRILKSP